MYRILIADDEGIMRESLKSIIGKNFGETCEVLTAKSGRDAIEQAESFHPDIVFMDIQMPGINGIDALREIRRTNSTALCYVISAYDKFDYAKEAIALGVERYLMKPINKQTMISTVEEAIEKVEKERRQKSDRLRVQEKLETIIPVVENGFVGSILMQNEGQDAEYYRQLLDIQEEYGYVIVLRFGREYQAGNLVSPVGVTLKVQDVYQSMCAEIKSYFHCSIGMVMSGSVAVVVPTEQSKISYEERIRIIETTRNMVGRLEEKIDAKFRAGIGRVRRIEDLRASYLDAFQALNEDRSRVIHTDDLTHHGVYKDDFPADTEKAMYYYLLQGDVEKMCQEADAFFQWMVRRYPENLNNIRLKVLEFVIQSECSAFHAGAVDYGFQDRADYLTDVLSLDNVEDLRLWLMQKMTSVCLSVRNRQESQSETAVQKAMAYIKENYSRDISLDDVSREVNISPYYFSKLFKEEAGENFIEYLTRIRMEKAKELLGNPALSVKEIGMACGYADPNYFSRIFKKHTDMTPREYREKQE